MLLFLCFLSRQLFILISPADPPLTFFFSPPALHLNTHHLTHMLLYSYLVLMKIYSTVSFTFTFYSPTLVHICTVTHYILYSHSDLALGFMSSSLLLLA